MEEKKISWLTDEVGMSTLNFVLLGIFTGGIYYFIWLTERYYVFNSLESNVLTKQTINIAAVLFGLNIILGTTGNGVLILLGSVASLAGWIMLIVMTFKIIKAIEMYYAANYKLDLKFNKIWMVLFHLFYVNYCINELKEIEEKNSILNQNDQ